MTPSIGQVGPIPPTDFENDGLGFYYMHTSTFKVASQSPKLCACYDVECNINCGINCCSLRFKKATFDSTFYSGHKVSNNLTSDLTFPARALRVLGLLVADGAPTVRRGRLFEPSTGFFYGNSCNSGTESRKIVSNVGN